MLGNSTFRIGDGDKLAFPELVLAQHAARVAPGRARFRTEGRRERGEAQRQFFLLENFARYEVGQRHFRRRDQPAAISRPEQVLGEFRQLPGAEHRLVTHHQWRRDFGIAVLAGVQVDHELAERPLQTRQLAGQHRETRTGELGSAFEIHIAERFANLEVLLCRVVPAGLLAGDAGHHIVVLVLAIGHIVEGHVRQARQGIVQLGGDLTVLFLGARHVFLDISDFGFQLFRQFHVLLRHGGADFLGGGVAAGLHILQRLDDGTALFIESDQTCRRGLYAAPCKGRIKSFGVFAYPFNVVHRRSRPLLHRRVLQQNAGHEPGARIFLSGETFRKIRSLPAPCFWIPPHVSSPRVEPCRWKSRRE